MCMKKQQVQTHYCFAVAEDGNINVNEEMCIQCGACFDNCMHEARDFDDDTAKFLSDLKNGKKLSVIIAPAFIEIIQRNI